MPHDCKATRMLEEMYLHFKVYDFDKDEESDSVDMMFRVKKTLTQAGKRIK